MFIILGIYLSGCVIENPQAQVAPSPTMGLLTPPAITSEVTATLVAQFIQTTDSQTALPVTTITSIPPHTSFSMIDSLTNLHTQCLDEVSPLPDNVRTQGFLVFRDSSLLLAHSQLHIYNLVSEIDLRLAEEYYGLSFSPDQKHMYYTDCSDRPCIETIATAEGVVVTFPQDPDLAIIRWLDDKHILFSSTIEPYNSFNIYNPFSGTEETFSLNLPNPYFTPLLDFPRLENATDPSLTRVIYFDTEGIGRVIMWDRQDNRMLAWLPYPVPYAPLPGVGDEHLYGWSPDGSQFIVNSSVGDYVAVDGNPAQEELFSVNRNGEISQLTHFNRRFNLVRIYNYRWSPNASYIAFWAKLSEYADQPIEDLPNQLLILDTDTLDVISFCISSSSNFPPIWSPNSELISYTIRGIREGSFILDLSNNNLFGLTTSMSPEGWIISP